ncbi:hypothetical protein D6D25_05380 [Aureobasidium pullulans]|nr:hypothetical protein D6D25_05380 [Aureobasidium pullulans]
MIISIAMNSMRANASATSYWTILILVITTRPVATASSHSARTTSFGTLSKLLNSTKTSSPSALKVPIPARSHRLKQSSTHSRPFST